MEEIEILQLNRENSVYAFCSYGFLWQKGVQLNASQYDSVYKGTMQPGMNLENSFARFNINRPKDFKGHSLSVSDVVIIRDNKVQHAFILRLNNGEMHHLKKQVEKSGLSREVYVRKLIMGREIKERPQQDCVELLKEVRAQGHLLTAVAQDALARGGVSTGHVDDLRQSYKALLSEVKKLV